MTNVTFSFETSPNKNPKRKTCRGHGILCAPRIKKWGDTSPVFSTKLRPRTKDNYCLDGKTAEWIVSKTCCKRFSKKLKKIIIFCKHLPKKSLVERRITTLVNAFCLLNVNKKKSYVFHEI